MRCQKGTKRLPLGRQRGGMEPMSFTCKCAEEMRGESLLRAQALALGATRHLSCHLPKARAQMNKHSVHCKQEHTVQHSKTPSASKCLRSNDETPGSSPSERTRQDVCNLSWRRDALLSTGGEPNTGGLWNSEPMNVKVNLPLVA